MSHRAVTPGKTRHQLLGSCGGPFPFTLPQGDFLAERAFDSLSARIGRQFERIPLCRGGTLRNSREYPIDLR
jgi:hypothetical protein